MSAALILNFTAMRAAITFVPLYILELGASGEEEAALISGIAGAVSGIGLVVSAPLWGVVGDRYGRKPMLVRASLGAVMVTAGMGLSRVPSHLIIVRLVQGIMTGIVSAGPALMASLVPARRLSRSIGMTEAAFFGGAVIGPLLGGVLIDFIGYRSTYLCLAVLPLISAVLLILLVEEDFEPDEAISGEGLHTLMSWGRSLASLKEFRNILLVGIGLRLGLGMLEPVLPLLVQPLAGARLVSSTVGMVVAASSLAAAISALAAGRLIERWKYRPVLLWADLGACLVATLVALAGSVVHVLVLISALGLFQGALRAANTSYIGHTIPGNRRGIGYGTATSLSSVGGALGPLLAGGIAAVGGISSAFVALGLVFVSLAVWIGKRVVEPIESTSF